MTATILPQIEKLTSLALKIHIYWEKCCCSVLCKLRVAVKLGLVKQTNKK